MSELDPRVTSSLASLREESMTPPRPHARAAARLAVHAALLAQPPRPVGLGALIAMVRRHRLTAVGGLAAAACAVVAAVGWSAPPGTPLHDVRLARERVAVLFSGDSPTLRLSYAEDRLHDARNSSNPRALLDEAGSLLGDVATAVSVNANDPLHQRLIADQQELTDEQAVTPPATTVAGTPSGSGGARPPAGAAHASAMPTASPTPRSGGEGEGQGHATPSPRPTDDSQTHQQPSQGPTPGGDGRGGWASLPPSP